MTVCPSCGTENREGARFCDSCGAPLASAAKSGREERKIVTVLFCDLVGFTAHSERADPEDVRARLRPYHELLRERVEAFGGVVEKFIGDAAMAVFGAPTAHEDDAERAVRAGLSILESLDQLNVSDPALSLDVRIGVNTGEALVSLDARPEQGEGIVTGDVVNTAARIQAGAPVHGIAVGEGTYRAVEHVFEWITLEPIVAKGKSGALALWQPLRPVARFGSDVIRTHSTPFVGRDVERTLLLGLLDRSIRDRTVQLATLVGEPGVGKSRQVAELLQDVDRRPELVRWRQGRCLPYGDGIAFWALGEIVKAHAGIFESDPPETAREKLRAVLPEGAERAWLEERLVPLAGVEPTANAERAESFSAWQTFLESIAERDPTVLVVEDIHWADPALLDFLEHLVEHASGVPLMVVCTARPELADRAPGWAGGLRNATTITLDPLSETETAGLVDELLERVVLPAELRRAIVERSGGNPLYAEEVVRLLRDRELLDGRSSLEELPLPETVHAIIAARLDALPPDRKGLLQDAAVLGKVFWAGAVAAIANEETTRVADGLHELERRELVRASRTSAMEGEAEHAFWHALVRDVAYGQIPRPLRAAKHVAAADWIEAGAGGRTENVADFLAHHLGEAVALFEATGDDTRADELRPRLKHSLLLAAERALSLDPARAVPLYERVLEQVPADDPARAELVVGWAWAVFNGEGNVKKAAAALDEVLPVLRAGDDPVLAATALTRRDIMGRLLGDEATGALAEEAVSTLEAVGPSRALVDALTELAGTLMATQLDLRRAIAIVDRAEAISRTLGVEFPARALAFRGGAKFELGDDSGLSEMEEALERLLAAGASRNAGVVMFNRARAYAEIEGPRSLARFEETRAYALARGHESHARFALRAFTFMLAEQGRYEDVLEIAALHAPALDRGGELDTVTVIRSFAAWSLVHRGDPGAEAELAVLREQSVGEGTAYALLAAAAWAGYADDRVGVREALSALVADPTMLAKPGIRRNWAAIARFAARTAESALIRDAVHDWLETTTGTARPYIATLAAATRAVLAEGDGDFERAAELAESAVEPLAGFLAFPEQGYALLLLGKARLALGDPMAGDALLRARSVFERLGMAPARADTDEVLRGAISIDA